MLATALAPMKATLYALLFVTAATLVLGVLLAAMRAL